ncbi:hypothetical protein BH10BAC5_BH10BAC5_22950 [soil metagenome]
MRILRHLLSGLILIVFYANGFSQTQQIIIKLKSSTPQSIINNFMSGAPSIGDNKLSKLTRSLNISSSIQLFGKFQELTANDAAFKSIGLDKIFIININNSNSASAIELLSKNEYVEYAEINRVLKLNSLTPQDIIPNDTYYSNQYYLPSTQLNKAWEITLGDSNVLIGVIDTGLDFLHPDLQNSFKINYGESGLDALGRDKRTNGIDDDGNGFIDDWRGYDFTDEPFTGDPRRGDYLTPDNDPTDDNKNSHGTAVTGIINASFNNSLGISSVSPNCKVLVLRAFDAEGSGEEDDVASAILYGISRNVRIFNFSFGDYIFSNLLKDVIKYSYTKNVVIICSAGNDGSDNLHYPSSYDEVISVGASDASNNKASFSSYGHTVDIFAPGSQIFTTVRTGKGNSQYQNNYDYINGTSFSAPIVTGISALLLSKNPSLTNEEVRGILVSSTDRMAGQSVWNKINASGSVNAFKTLGNSVYPSIARIHYPFQDFSTDKDTIPICITAASPLFQNYSVSYMLGSRGDSWIPLLNDQSSQVVNDTVFRWNVSSIPDTTITLRLSINSSSGRTIEHRMVITKDKNPPVINQVSSGDIIDKNNYAHLIILTTNKRTSAKIYYKRKNIAEPYKVVYADIGTPNTSFVLETHFALLTSGDLSYDTDYEYYIEAKALNNKIVTLSDPSFYFHTQKPITNYGFIQKPYSLFNAQSCNSVIDINGNGNKDIYLNDIKHNLRLNLFEFSGGTFNKISNDNWNDFKVARDVGQVTGSGRYDLLLSKLRNGFLYEAPTAGSLPVNLIWSDSAANNFWSSRIADTDNDGKKEILGFGDNDNALRIIEYNNGFVEKAKLSYFTKPGRNGEAISQNCVVEDLDNDGRNEIAFVNSYDDPNYSLPLTAISVYRSNGGSSYSRVFIDTVDMQAAGDNIISGDFDGDGIKDFAVGTVSNNNDLLQFYRLFVYKSFGPGNFGLMDVVDIYNYKSYTETSTKAGNIDNDGKSEIMVNVGTNFYILKFNNSLGRFEPILYKDNINTNNQIIYDFDNNGINEIGLNTINDTLLFYEKNSFSIGPSTPLNITGYSLDSNRNVLNFAPSSDAQYYRIYRAITDSNQIYTLYDSVSSNHYEDINVLNNKNYYYKLSSVNNTLSPREGIISESVKVFTHSKARVISAVTENGLFVIVALSQKISSIIPSPVSFKINNTINPRTIAVKSSNEYLLTFDNRLSNGPYSLRSSGLTDFYGSPVDTNVVTLDVNVTDSVKFYIKKISLIEKYKLKVELNLSVDSISAKNPLNYTITPFNIRTTGVSIDVADRSIIYLNLDNSAVIGATGKIYILSVKNIYSFNGIKITEGAGGSFGLIFHKEDLNDAYVYPNPFTTSSGQSYITFANLTVNAAIDIFDLTGKYIRTIEETEGFGGIEWDLKDLNGNSVPTGIYIYMAKGKNSNGQDVADKTGKFMIIR